MSINEIRIRKLLARCFLAVAFLSAVGATITAANGRWLLFIFNGVLFATNAAGAIVNYRLAR